MRRVCAVTQDDPLAAPLLAELAVEYSSRYGGSADEVRRDLITYPAAEFAPPDGALLVVVENEEPVAGGAFRRYDETTAELKRIWTAREHRRRGLGRFVLAQLETEIARRGYRRVYLTTGPRQPEAVALYNSCRVHRARTRYGARDRPAASVREVSGARFTGRRGRTGHLRRAPRVIRGARCPAPDRRRR